MTVFNAKYSRPAPGSALVRTRLMRTASLRTGLFGVAVGMLAALGAVHAAPAMQVVPLMAQVAPTGSVDPAKQLPGAIAVSNIDFSRGQGGSGKLTVSFSGDGALADLRNQGTRVVIDVPNARLPASLQRPLDVTDFATPVQQINAYASGAGTRLVLDTSGGFESMAYQTGNEYIVEIAPRAVPETRVASATADAATTVSTTSGRSYSGNPVTFNFQDVPVRTVLQLIAEETDLNLVASDSVTGNVTLRLVNVPWDQALDIVLRANGLDQRRDGNVIWVAPQSEIAQYEQDIQDARIAIENRAATVTEYIPINYANAEEIANLLTEQSLSGGGGAAGGGESRGFLSPRGSISFDTRTNTLLVIDIPDKVTEVKRLVALLDKPVDQVLIEARIVIATETFARELGAKFGISGSAGTVGDRSSVGFGGNTDASSQNAQDRADAVIGGDPRGRHDITQGLNVNLPVIGAAGSLALSILNAGYLLDVELSALQQEGRGEVISNPRIVTSNQREAVIRQGQEVGYVTISPSQGGGAIPIPNVQFKEVLLELRVTPTITNDGRVFMALAVTKDEIEGFTDTSIGEIPQISTREVTTAVLIEDGQTVVIGGVYEFRDRDDVSKVPFLGDLPIIGNLFKTKGRSQDKAELLIFVTPKVMRVAQRD